MKVEDLAEKSKFDDESPLGVFGAKWMDIVEKVVEDDDDVPPDRVLDLAWKKMKSEDVVRSFFDITGMSSTIPNIEASIELSNKILDDEELRKSVLETEQRVNLDTSSTLEDFMDIIFSNFPIAIRGAKRK